MVTLQKRDDRKNTATELSNNRTDALEILREALSNAKDHRADQVYIRTWKDRNNRISLLIVDNGHGLNDARFGAFFGIGTSDKEDAGTDKKIGHKGHGTKLYLECRRLLVASHANGDSGWRYTEEHDPLKHADKKDFDVNPLPSDHPQLTHLRELGLLDHTGTLIYMEELECYDADLLIQRRRIETYLDWHTVQGDIRSGLFDTRGEFQAAVETRSPHIMGLLLDHEAALKPLDVRLRLNGEASYTRIGQSGPFLAPWGLPPGPLASFGHRFADSALSKAGSQRGVVDDNSAIRLTGPDDWYSDTGIAIVAHVEGNARQRATYSEARWNGHPGLYTFDDRWGLWLCKDFIPIVQHNDLLERALQRSAPALAYEFKKLRNWKVFVHDSSLVLIANRTAFANRVQREQQIVDALTATLTEAVKRPNFRAWIQKLQIAKSARAKDHEVADANERRDASKKWLIRKNRASINPLAAVGLSPVPKGHALTMPEPVSEQDVVLLYGILTGRYRMPVEILNYEEHKGIDAIGLCHEVKLSPLGGTIVGVEFKFEVEARQPIDHYFEAIDVLICWRVRTTGPIYEVTSDGHGELRKRNRPVLASKLDTHEIVHDKDGVSRVIPVLELRTLFPKRRED